jgi:hypothetical protein
MTTAVRVVSRVGIGPAAPERSSAAKPTSAPVKASAIQEKFRTNSTSSRYCSHVAPPETEITSYICHAP